MKIFAKSPDPNGYLFWERKRWKFGNPNGDQEDAYDELSILLEKIVDTHFERYYGDLVVRMHDDYGDTYQLYCEYEDSDIGYLTAQWDWLEAQNEMYLDWVALFDELIEEVHQIIMDDGGDICERETT